MLIEVAKQWLTVLIRCFFSPGPRWPRVALRLLGAGRLGSGGRRRQPAKRRVGRGRPAQQPAHANPRGEHFQDPASEIHGDPVLQGPLLQPRILRGDAQQLKPVLKCLLSSLVLVIMCNRAVHNYTLYTAIFSINGTLVSFCFFFSSI